MIQLLWRHDRTFNQTYLRASFLTLTRVPCVNDRMPDWEFEIFADVRVQTHDINIEFAHSRGLYSEDALLQFNPRISHHVYVEDFVVL
jgi:hypothetical protein